MPAPTAASASNNIAVDGTGGTIFSGKGEAIVIACKTGSTVNALVNVSSLHASGEFYEIEAGQREYFVKIDGDLGTVTAKGNSGGLLPRARSIAFMLVNKPMITCAIR